jgi:hypothetical protein
MTPIGSKPKFSWHQANCSSGVSFHGGTCWETSVSPTQTGTSSNAKNSLAKPWTASSSHQRWAR